MIAYAIAGRVDIDFETEPLITLDDGKEVPTLFVFLPQTCDMHLYQVFLRDIWPSRADIQKVESKYVIPRMFEVGLPEKTNFFSQRLAQRRGKQSKYQILWENCVSSFSRSNYG